MRKIILDTETTGIGKGHRIIEIGCVEMVNRRMTNRSYHQYLQPDRQIDAGAARVHGITNAMLEGNPRFVDIVDEFMDFIRGAELVIHNAPFDVGFINYELQLLNNQNWQPLDTYCTILDSLVLAKKLHPSQKNNLDALCKRYYIDNSNRELHGALLDAEILAEVYLAMTGGQVSLLSSSSSQQVEGENIVKLISSSSEVKACSS
jgi:DNA polymerase-3 subunit epsilon